MNYPIIPSLPFDLNQEFEINKRPDELYILGEKQNVIVPRYAPFFINSLKIRDDKGQPLIEGTDYRIFRMMGRLSALCANGVSCLIEILNPALKNLYLTYHAVGYSSLFDRSMIELINNAANDQRLIKWPNIHGKPVVFRPKFHNHSLIYDTVMFQDTIDLINLWADSLNTSSDDYSAITLEQQTNLVRFYIERNAPFITSALARHQAQINEHGLTKTQIGKDKVDNIITASLSDAVKGVPNQRLTPAGLQQIINRYGYTDSAFLKANVLPISFYGNTSFIPPAIGGSFEGLGSKDEAACICMESDGNISFLSNHFDGRVDGLYFSIVNNYPSDPKFSYQSFRYDHPILSTAGVVPNTVAQSNGAEVLFVGKSNRWFVALTNGTLDPNYHTMVEVDVTGFNQNSFVGGRLSAHLMGDYVIIIQAFESGVVPDIGADAKQFWRIPVSAIKSSTKVTPTKLNVSFMNFDGKQFNNAPLFIWTEPVQDANGHFTRLMFKYTQPLEVTATNNCLYRTQSVIAVPVPNKPGIWLLKFFTQHYIPIQNSYGLYDYAWTVELSYEFNPVTGVMTIQNYLPTMTLDASSPSKDTAGQLSSYYGETLSSVVTSSFSNNCSTILDDGTWLVACTGEVSRTPHVLAVLKLGVKSKYESLAKRFTRQNYPLYQYNNVTEGITSPLKNSTHASSVTQDPEGEFFIGVGQNTTSARATFFRKLTGEYAVRDSFQNVNFPNVLSRPLTNNVYETNIPALQPRVGITGDAAFLSAAGYSNLGETNFHVGVQGKFWINPTTGWKEGTLNDISVRIPRGYTRVIDNTGKYNYTPQGFTTYPAAIIQSLFNTLVPAAYRNTPNYSVCILDTKHISNAKITSRPVVIQIHYVDIATQMRRCVVATLNTTYNTSNAADYIVTGATVISSVDRAVQPGQRWVTSTSWPITYQVTSQSSNAVEMYYSGTTINIIINTAYYTQHQGNAGMHGSQIVINQSNHTIASGGGYVQTWEGPNTLGHIPKVGMVTKLSFSYSGATAELLQSQVDGKIYGRVSCYPDPSWSVFFQSDVEVIFNGKSYSLPAGVVDLRSIKADPSNTTFYVYVRLTSGEPEYVITEVKTFDTTYNMWIGTIVTNANQILSISRSNVLLLNGARISDTKRGGAIPASNGLITEQGQFAWLRSDEIIPG